MSTKPVLRLAAGLAVGLLLAGCENYVQTTSGSKYLDRYAAESRAVGAGPMDDAIREAANVEPVLTFPARIGVARIDGGRLSPIPEAESEAWIELAHNLGPKWGTFVPVSPLIIALSGGDSLAVEPKQYDRCRSSYHCTYKAIHDIRLGAARQHLDAVLIYEVFAASDQTSNPLAVTKLALIGFFMVPSETIEADGMAQAVLVDVRNGYTYGFASAVAEDAALTLSTSINSDEAAVSAKDRAKTAAALKLTGEVEQMARDLRLELAERRAAKAESASD